MGCTDTVSTVGSVPGRRVAPGEETQNRVARWEACRRTNRNTHACKSTAPSNTRSRGHLRVRGVLQRGVQPGVCQAACQSAFSSLLINQPAWLTMQIPYARYYYCYFWHQQMFFSLFFLAFPRSAAWFCLRMADVVK